MKRQIKKSEMVRDSLLSPVYASFGEDWSIPKYRLADGPVPPRLARDLVRDELMLDGNARLNLATFVTTSMEDEAAEVMAMAFDKNMVDKDEYPQTAELELRCVNIIANLWNSPDEGDAVGTSTVGSSEGAMLAGMALKWRWKARQQAAGKPTDKPNFVMGINVQACWDKFCRYWEIEQRLVPMDGDRFHISPEEATKLCDENTLGVVGILGSTWDGSYEPIKELCACLDALQNEQGLDIPLHVDAASGGFIAPFLDPDLEWDFRLPRVASINASGHKFGGVYPGVGWVIWRDENVLPDDLIFYTNYLGGRQANLGLNFSRPGNQVVGQYYNFVRFGFDGYREMQTQLRRVAIMLAHDLEKLGPLELVTRGTELPVVTFKLKDDVEGYTVFDLSDRLREHGWQVPAYTFPANREDVSVMRVVVRNGTSPDLMNSFIRDVKRAIAKLEKVAAGEVHEHTNFHH